MNRLAYKWNPEKERIETCGVSTSALSRLDMDRQSTNFKGYEYTCAHCNEAIKGRARAYSNQIYDIRVFSGNPKGYFVSSGFYICNWCAAIESKAIYTDYTVSHRNEVHNKIKSALRYLAYGESERKQR